MIRGCRIRSSPASTGRSRFDELVGQEHVGAHPLQRHRIGPGRACLPLRRPPGRGQDHDGAHLRQGAELPGGGERTTGRPEPCGTCVSCVDITAGVDLDVVEMDAASNNPSMTCARLREQVGYATVRSRYRIWIVDEVHMLSLSGVQRLPEDARRAARAREVPLLHDGGAQAPRHLPQPLPAGGVPLHRGRGHGGATRTSSPDAKAWRSKTACAGTSRAPPWGGCGTRSRLLEQLIAASPGTGRSRARISTPSPDGRRACASTPCSTPSMRATPAAPSTPLDALSRRRVQARRPPRSVAGPALRQRLLDAARAPRTDDVAAGVVGRARALDVLLAKRVHLRSGADGALVCQVAAVELARLPDARDLDAPDRGPARRGRGRVAACRRRGAVAERGAAHAGRGRAARRLDPRESRRGPVPGTRPWCGTGKPRLHHPRPRSRRAGPTS